MLTPAEQVAAWMLLGITAYAVFGNADFGGGIWHTLARGPRATDQRSAVFHAMGPVWEANHVWLVFTFILLISGFPAAFRNLSVALFVPLNLALALLVLRGTAFAFRIASEPGSRRERIWGGVFGFTSLILPLGLGAALGATASGGITIDAGIITAPPLASWLSPLALGVGILTMLVSAFLAAVFLTMETVGTLQGDYRRRALVTGALLILAAALLLPVVAREAPFMWERLDSGALWFVVVGFVAAIAAFAALWLRRYALARVAAVAEVAFLLWSWVAAQWPYIIYPGLPIEAAAAPAPTLRFMLTALPLGMLLLVPSLLFLFYVFKKDDVAMKEQE